VEMILTLVGQLPTPLRVLLLKSFSGAASMMILNFIKAEVVLMDHTTVAHRTETLTRTTQIPCILDVVPVPVPDSGPDPPHTAIHSSTIRMNAECRFPSCRTVVAHMALRMITRMDHTTECL